MKNIPKYIRDEILKDDKLFLCNKKKDFNISTYSPQSHYIDLTRSDYYYGLVIFRHYFKVISDYYFGKIIGAKNLDLFMLTPSISSPMGSGSDSKAIKIKFGKFDTFLVDSSQFGFEPLLLNNLDKVYCYLPSMRGENSDKRHLNQFYHCEMEMKGTLDDLFPIVGDYLRILAETILLMKNIVNKISENPKKTKEFLREIIKLKEFPRITFDEAVSLLVNNGQKNLVNFTKQGNDISCEGEIELMKILKIKTPIYLTCFDRNRVPFYQKPNPSNPNKTINADLLFPPIIKNAFGGEIIGSGQRQDNPNEMYQSLKQQKNISSKIYEWYIDLRRQQNYKITSGFGLGVERFIAWSLGKENIKDVILYPRIKNIRAYP